MDNYKTIVHAGSTNKFDGGDGEIRICWFF